MQDCISEKTLYQIATTLIPGVGSITARQLIDIIDEESLFKKNINDKIIPERIKKSIQNKDLLIKAEKELDFAIKNNIKIVFFKSKDYPKRLKNCIDAPILLYAKGNINLNPEKTIGIVGTRNASNYGLEFCENFIKDISKKIPTINIISGLAYGIDTCAHKKSIENNISTIGILAHGLDKIYPHSNRKTAIEMLENGGLITEFTTNTNPEKYNFVKRNRIIAGLSDALIVVESKEKGGSLITADIAMSYFRDVFAVPGRIDDKNSQGCNNLIKDNKATLLNNATDLISQMQWDYQKEKPLQKEIFVNLTDKENIIVDIIKEKNQIHINSLCIESNTPVYELSITLLELEMKGVIKSFTGGIYKYI